MLDADTTFVPLCASAPQPTTPWAVHVAAATEPYPFRGRRLRRGRQIERSAAAIPEAVGRAAGATADTVVWYQVHLPLAPLLGGTDSIDELIFVPGRRLGSDPSSEPQVPLLLFLDDIWIAAAVSHPPFSHTTQRTTIARRS